jgi:glycerol-3-phosphate acyltransferase PlsY
MNYLIILWIVFACIIAYFIGSIPFSVWIGNLATGKDLREYNIGNPGGFNAIITYGAKVGLTIAYLDILKGTLSIALIDQIFSLSYFTEGGTTIVWHLLACILGPAFCILGHNYSVWLRFQGGRGFGVIMGTMLYMNPLVYIVYMVMTAIQTQALKLPSRFANILAGFVVVPAAFFMPIFPPWTTIASLWVLGGTGYAFMIQGFVVLLMWIAILPRNWSGVIHAFSGKEWSFSALGGGQKISDEFGTKKESVEKE